MVRDHQNVIKLRSNGWRVLILWNRSLLKTQSTNKILADIMTKWITSCDVYAEIDEISVKKIRQLSM
jgi:G:T-mismatch repair DNA endonuclease (very short patch repair protein)